MSETRITAEFPHKLQCLFEPARYKVLYGGRGAAKSWGVARALLLEGARQKLRIFCGREIQESIKQSVHTLLSDQIEALGLRDFYEIQSAFIKGANGTEFSFHGLKHNIDALKSAEGCDRAWIEEAQTVSKASWEKLIPTIRKDGSEIWVTFNPELEEDETFQRFVLKPPPNAVVTKLNWSDNPWFPEVLKQEKDYLQATDKDAYLTVWEGHCRQALAGAVYADELRVATEQGRVCAVKHDASKAVHVFCDLGYSDYTSLWFVQKIGLEYRVLLAYQNRLQKWSHYLQYMQDTRWLLGVVTLPHDGASEQLGSKTIEAQTREAGLQVRVLPNQRGNFTNGLNYARELFPQCYFDAVNCADGLTALRRYVWDKTPQGLSMREPKHDEHSHFADAWRYAAVGFREVTPRDQEAAKVMRSLRKEIRLDLPLQSGNWMG